MKINFVKQPGGILVPASDLEAERMVRFKTFEYYEIDIKQVRNPAFHRKVFVFFNYCFEFWCDSTGILSEQAQFDKFRKDLTIMAGYHNKVYNIRGELRLEAMSLAFGNMDQETFEQCYIALTNTAMKELFKSTDQETYNKLMSFF